MSEGKGGFWTSLPGVLTGLAALISSLAGAGFLLSNDGGSDERYVAPEQNIAAHNNASVAVASGNEQASAVDNSAVDNSAVDNEATAEVAAKVEEPPPAAVADLDVPVRPIAIENACSKPISFWLAYEAARGWTTSEGDRWNIDGNEVTRPTYNGNLLNAKSADAYYYAWSADGTEWSGDVDFGGLKALRRTTMEVDQYGDYRIKLTCD